MKFWQVQKRNKRELDEMGKQHSLFQTFWRVFKNDWLDRAKVFKLSLRDSLLQQKWKAYS